VAGIVLLAGATSTSAIALELLLVLAGLDIDGHPRRRARGHTRVTEQLRDLRVLKAPAATPSRLRRVAVAETVA
jgi:hypothetical protein